MSGVAAKVLPLIRNGFARLTLLRPPDSPLKALRGSPWRTGGAGRRAVW